LKIKFIIDECTGKRLSILLKKAGYEVIFVGDWKPSASDDEVLKKANEEGRVLITDDKDFGELVFRLNKPTSGVILIRTSTIAQKKTLCTWTHPSLILPDLIL
jgi:predicted nuclease of predicted toxin-antitoxin system